MNVDARLREAKDIAERAGESELPLKVNTLWTGNRPASMEASV